MRAPVAPEVCISSLATTPGAERWKNAKRNRKVGMPHMTHARGVGRAGLLTRGSARRAGGRTRRRSASRRYGAAGAQRLARRRSGAHPGKAQLPGLGRVIVGVGRVKGEPAEKRIWPLLAVRPRARPVVRAQPVEQLGRRLVGRADGGEGWLDGPGRVREAPAVDLLVEGREKGRVLREETA